jgi:putative transposase
MSTGVTYQYLESRPKSAYRQLFVKNTRIRAELIYRAHVNSEEPMNKKRYLIHDRDPLYTAQFLGMLAESGIEPVKLPPPSPNLNAFAERFVRSIKEECLQRIIFFTEDSLRTAVHEYLAHYHAERNHQGLSNQLLTPIAVKTKQTGAVQRKERLAGTLSYYYRDAA